MNQKVGIAKLKTGVPGLDEALGGGLPEYSFNLIAGGPGSGKTTLAHQILFANATEQSPAIYFTVLGEPPLKMLRYQQQFGFFDLDKLSRAVRFVHLGQELLEGGLEQVLNRITAEVERSGPSMVVVDSFRSMLRESASTHREELDLQHFVQLLALRLTTSQATTFLVGEYLENETHGNPLFTVADGILWLYQEPLGSSVVRQLQVVKLRGQDQLAGRHSLKISNAGVRIFPRLSRSPEIPPSFEPETRRLSTGVKELDEMLGGGIPAGYSTLLAGPSGSGKTVLASQFLLEGARTGEPGIIALFEREPWSYLRTHPSKEALQKRIQEGLLKLVYLQPLDLSVDEALDRLGDEAHKLGAKRMVLDSLSGFELALAPVFRKEFRESVYRLTGGLSALGLTLMSISEVTESPTGRLLSSSGLSFLTDCLVLQHYVEAEGALRRGMAVVKLRSYPHSKELREYEVSSEGLVVGRKLENRS